MGLRARHSLHARCLGSYCLFYENEARADSLRGSRLRGCGLGRLFCSHVLSRVCYYPSTFSPDFHVVLVLALSVVQFHLGRRYIRVGESCNCMFVLQELILCVSGVFLFYFQISMILAFVVFLILFIWWETHHSIPIFNVYALKYHNFALVCLIMLTFGMFTSGAGSYLTFFWQRSKGFSAMMNGALRDAIFYS